jgi:predicted ATP-grasp superfamily ATP-dependent carboligase
MSPQRDLLEYKGEPPELERPFLVVHLTGWTDSGIAGQTAMGFLQARWNARTAATFDSDELIDYRARRPIVRLASGTIEAVSWSDIELSVGETVAGVRDALLLSGPEPDFRWHAFADRVTKLCLELGVTEVFGLGAFPAPSLHTDPVAVVSTSADPELAGRLETVPAIVELPAGIQSVIEERLHQADIPATGLWARVPPYLAGGTHPPAALALIQTLERLAGVTIDVTELEAAAKEHIEQVEQAIRERPQIAEFVEQIRNMVEQGAEQRLPSGDEIADELERFLSQQPPPDDDNRSM